VSDFGMTSSTSAMAARLRTSHSSDWLVTKPVRSSIWTRCITMMIAPVRLSSRRDNKVFLNHSVAALRLVSEWASSGFRGSSIMIRSPPRPVSVPPTEVANRDPLAVSSISVSESFCPIRAVGKTDRYQGASSTTRKSLECFLARSPEYETQMILRVGSWPRTKAGNATDAVIDLSERGGMLMISRLISPRRTRSSW
jgi:hypothetical protein